MIRTPFAGAMLAVLLLALPDVSTAGVDPHAAPPVAVTVTRDGDHWTADFTFEQASPVWAFFQSALLRESREPWRPSWWSVETPGVLLDRQGGYDVLRTPDGGPVPARVRISLRPQAGDLEADYDPALMFSDGTVALFSGQFDVMPLDTIEAARALPTDLNGLELEGEPSRVTWRDRAGPVLFNGERLDEAMAVDARTYVLFGAAHIRQDQGVTTVIDPGLPGWLGDELGGFTPRVMGFYADRLGPSRGGAPTLMVSWTGPTEHLSSMGGSVLPGLISMSFEGEGVLNPDREALDRAHWFIGHEAAHFWLGSNGLRYAFSREAWITEGGADLMAVRAIAAIDPAYDARTELQREVEDCVSLARDSPVAGAGERGEHRAYYACGAVWSLALEAARHRADGGDFFDILTDFQRESADDGVLSRDEWLAALTRLAADPAPAGAITRMLDEGVGDPAAVLATIFMATGVAHRLDGGTLTLL
ncbi:hypothetical protein [Brevundimonas sp.]|uniref:hypothetical protein n=1 Tax=Brevundimonas sp. TaxID=1871086 RepID=UPI002487A6BD|nr:hypothetical protein [Brevundimonas sp.]MDI1281871.1 hypothetical protein [Brevundimonas sp.]